MEFTSGVSKVRTMGGDITIETENGVCEAYLAAPQGEGRYPGLVLIEEVWGVDEHIKNVADRFAAQGFIVLAPELLPEGLLKQLTPGLRESLFDPAQREKAQPILREAMAPIHQPGFSQEAIGKLRACVDYLVAHAQGNGKVGSLGFCFGGSYSLHLAVNDPRLDACVVFYGSAPEPLDQVAAIACPVLAFYGDQDERLMASLHAFKAAMQEHDQNFEAIVYQGAQHAFFNDTNKRTYDADAAEDAWNKSLAFLHKYLEV